MHFISIDYNNIINITIRGLNNIRSAKEMNSKEKQKTVKTKEASSSAMHFSAGATKNTAAIGASGGSVND